MLRRAQGIKYISQRFGVFIKRIKKLISKSEMGRVINWLVNKTNTLIKLNIHTNKHVCRHERMTVRKKIF